MSKTADHEESTWSKHQMLVLSELKRISDYVEKLNEKIDRNAADVTVKFHELHLDLAMLKLKASMWGAAAGVLATALVNLILQSIKVSH